MKSEAPPAGWQSLWQSTLKATNKNKLIAGHYGVPRPISYYYPFATFNGFLPYCNEITYATLKHDFILLWSYDKLLYHVVFFDIWYI